jgi:acetolactate synthase-1/3 small subunit
MTSHIISALVENKFGVLARIAGMFSGRGFNIDTLNVGPTHEKGLSRITLSIKGDIHALDQALKQLKKLVNVLDIQTFAPGEAVERELIVFKVAAAREERAEIAAICNIFRAKVVNVNACDMILEITGNRNKITSFLELLEPFEILEMARTGSVALNRKAASPGKQDVPAES